MTQQPPKFSPGLAKGMQVVTNARYARAYSKSASGRAGEIVAPCSAPGYVQVKLEGQRHGHALHRNFFDVVSTLPAGPGG